MKKSITINNNKLNDARRNLTKHIIQKKGRWGIMHYELDFEIGDYQHTNKVTGDSIDDIVVKARVKYNIN